MLVLCDTLPSISLFLASVLFRAASGKQVEKLRMLSVVSLAHTSKVVAYSTMKAALGMDNVRHLEDLIFDTMYAGLLQGKLDQRQDVLKVNKHKHKHEHKHTQMHDGMNYTVDGRRYPRRRTCGGIELCRFGFDRTAVSHTPGQAHRVRCDSPLESLVCVMFPILFSRESPVGAGLACCICGRARVDSSLSKGDHPCLSFICTSSARW